MSGSVIKSIVAIAVLALFGGFGTYLRGHQALPDRPPEFEQIPYSLDEYMGTEERFEQYAYDVLKADTTTLRMYRNIEGEVFWLFMAYFSSQKYGSQIHSPKHCLPGGGYKIQTIEPYDLDLGVGKNIRVNRLLIASPRRKEIMVYWFETRSGVISSEYGLKLDLMKNSVALQPTDAAICRLTMPLALDADFDEATERMTEFLRKLYPSMTSSLPFSE
ncbi:MAG: EpsI family protein [FCB group bacterium]|nr:EpsI family protein [FCB group bacterium]